MARNKCSGALLGSMELNRSWYQEPASATDAAYMLMWARARAPGRLLNSKAICDQRIVTCQAAAKRTMVSNE